MPDQLPTPVPTVTSETKTFWDGTAQGKLILPRCNSCQAVIWYPRLYCPECSSFDVSWFQASGRGSIYSFTINRRLNENADYRTPDRKEIVYVLAYVDLEEGPRIMTNIVDCDPESVRVGQKVQAVFHDTGQGSALVRFRPA